MNAPEGSLAERLGRWLGNHWPLKCRCTSVRMACSDGAVREFWWCPCDGDSTSSYRQWAIDVGAKTIIGTGRRR